MKLFYFTVFSIFIVISSCSTQRSITTDGVSVSASGVNTYNDTLITQSLFSDRNSTISEEAIQKILDGNYTLPGKLRVAIVKLDNAPSYRRFYWNNEEYLKTQQSYLDLFSQKLQQSGRVTNISVIPDLLISKTPSFTNIREAAVRMQADVVAVYSITSDLYSRYKLFSKTDLKAFATTQFIILDVRTGLVPFSAIVTKDAITQKRWEETGEQEATTRVQQEAVLLTINEIGNRINNFLLK